MTSRVLRMFFDRGVVFVPAGGRVLLSFHADAADPADSVEPLDLTDDLPLLLEAGLVLLEDPSAGRSVSPSSSSAALSDRSSASSMVDVATLEFPDRMRVYHDGRRLSEDEVGRAVEATVVSALRAAISAYAS